MTTAPESSGPGQLIDAFRELYSRAEEEASNNRRKERFWGRLYFWVGLPAAVLAAIAGAAALASTAGRVPAGIIALCASGLTAASVFLDSKTREAKHGELAAAWQILANDVKVHIMLDSSDEKWTIAGARKSMLSCLAREGKLLRGNAPNPETEAEMKAAISELRGRVLAESIQSLALSEDTDASSREQEGRLRT